MCKGPMPPELIEPVIDIRKVIFDCDKHKNEKRWWYICPVCLEETGVKFENDVDFRCTKCNRVIWVDGW